LLIGAPGLSEAAKELEMYGNAQNLAALEEKTGPVLAMYRSLKSLLRPYVEDNESSKKEVSSDDWITVLEQMHQCVEQFDMDGVDHAMETMDTFQTPDKLKDLTLNTPDLILLDYAMPIVDGSQIMQMLREDPEFHHIPIIFLTGKNDAETVKNVMSLKPDGYLLKSMNPQKLHAAIDDFFASRGK
jgi:CheY-like chemotaxis protein